MSWKTWIGLLLCNMAWSLNPTFAKIIIHEIGPELTAWIKYSVALVAYGVFVFLFNAHQRKTDPKIKLFISYTQKKDFYIVVLIGFSTCFIAPFFQMIGLGASSATHNAILVTFEPIFTVLFGWLIFKERLLYSHLLSFSLASIGFLILSKFFDFQSGTFHFKIAFGDLILLLAIAGESIYSVLGRKLSLKYPGHLIFGSAMLVGCFLLSLVILPRKNLSIFSHLSIQTWGAIFSLGVLGTALPYLYWLHALKESKTLASVVLSLFLQPLLGTVSAVIFLGEPFQIHQLVGAVLLMIGVGNQVYFETRPTISS